MRGYERMYANFSVEPGQLNLARKLIQSLCLNSILITFILGHVFYVKEGDRKSVV